MLANMVLFTTGHSIPETQYRNFLAIDLLEKAGNKVPTQAEIDATESLFMKFRHRRKKIPLAVAVEKIREIFMEKTSIK